MCACVCGGISVSICQVHFPLPWYNIYRLSETKWCDTFCFAGLHQFARVRVCVLITGPLVWCRPPLIGPGVFVTLGCDLISQTEALLMLLQSLPSPATLRRQEKKNQEGDGSSGGGCVPTRPPFFYLVWDEAVSGQRDAPAVCLDAVDGGAVDVRLEQSGFFRSSRPLTIDFVDLRSALNCLFSLSSNLPYLHHMCPKHASAKYCTSINRINWFISNHFNRVRTIPSSLMYLLWPWWSNDTKLYWNFKF